MRQLPNVIQQICSERGLKRLAPSHTQQCDECESPYLVSKSWMAHLCPECAHYLYGCPKCEHSFIHGRCSLCHWDGSVSSYIQTLKNKIQSNLLLNYDVDMPGEQLVSISRLESFLQENNVPVRARWAEPMKGLDDAYYLLTAILRLDEIVVFCIDPSGQIEPSIEEIYEKLQ